MLSRFVVISTVATLVTLFVTPVHAVLTVNDGDVVAFESADNAARVDVWVKVATFTGADPTELEVMTQDVRWETDASPSLLEVGATPYRVQLLLDEAAGRDRRWDVTVVDNVAVSEVEGPNWVDQGRASYEFTLSQGEKLGPSNQREPQGGPTSETEGSTDLQGVILHAVPEPSTFALLLIGFCAFVAYLRRNSWRA